MGITIIYDITYDIIYDITYDIISDLISDLAAMNNHIRNIFFSEVDKCLKFCGLSTISMILRQIGSQGEESIH